MAGAIVNPSYAQCNMKNMDHSSGHKNNSSGTQNTKGANNGEIIKAGNYQFEIVFEPIIINDPLTIYVMNKKGKPIVNSEISGSAEITYKDGSTETVSLFAKGENAYSIPLKKTSQSFVCLLKIQIDKKIISVRYEYKGVTTNLINSSDSYYTCSMHPEIKSDKPGKCPKCGMTLEKATK